MTSVCFLNRGAFDGQLSRVEAPIFLVIPSGPSACLLSQSETGEFTHREDRVSLQRHQQSPRVPTTGLTVNCVPRLKCLFLHSGQKEKVGPDVRRHQRDRHQRFGERSKGKETWFLPLLSLVLFSGNMHVNEFELFIHKKL